MKRGSISIYLCLAMCVIFSLLFVCMDSARAACGRAAVSCALDESLFSLFSNYDREIYEDAGLLLLDGGYGSGKLQAGKIADEVTENLEEVLSPAVSGFGTTPEELYRISLEMPGISGYVLATDGNYAPLREQICGLMTEKCGIDALEKLTQSLSVSSQAASVYGFSDDQDTKALAAEYEQKKEQAQEMQRQAAALQEDAGGDNREKSAPSGQEQVPEDFVNPLDNAQALLELGAYTFAVPGSKKVSTARADTTRFVSRRDKEQGIGLLPEESTNAAEKILLTEYCMDFYSNFRTAQESENLSYQAEYVIAGKASDTGNLRVALDQILLLREGLNYLYLFTDPEKTAQIHKEASIISTVLLSPEGEEAVAQLLMLFWSYAESLMDVKSLLQGNRVPLFKDAGSWQVPIDLLATMTQGMHVKDCGRGFSYEEYLRILLYMLPEQTLLERTMDMLEYNRQTKHDAADFRLDHALVALQVGYEGRVGMQEIRITRSYGYDMPAQG